MHYFRLFLLALCLSIAGACGGGTSGTASFDTSFNDRTMLSSLTTDELAVLCGEIRGFLRGLLSPEGTFCPYLAISETIEESESVEFCQAEELLCEAIFGSDQVQSEIDQFTANFECNFDGISACPATIGEFEACFNVFFDNTEANIMSLSCTSETIQLTEEGLDGLVLDETSVIQSPECQVIESKCPGFL